jgi:hypothetical protein
MITGLRSLNIIHGTPPNIYMAFLLLIPSILVIAFGTMYIPLLLAKTGKLNHITEGPLFNSVKNAMTSIGINETKFNVYKVPNMKKAVLNAAVTGYFDYTLIFFNDLLSILNQEEGKF